MEMGVEVVWEMGVGMVWKMGLEMVWKMGVGMNKTMGVGMVWKMGVGTTRKCIQNLIVKRRVGLVLSDTFSTPTYGQKNNQNTGIILVQKQR